MLIVTGATGQLGRLVMEHLLELAPADQVAAMVRDPGKAADLAARGIRIRTADYDNPHSLSGAFGTGDRVLLISGNDTARHVPQHLAVIDATKAAGVAQLAYTGILGGGAGQTVFAAHHTTEHAIQDSGLPYTSLRNGWYTENYTAQLPTMLERGVLLGSAAPDSRIASATHADYTAAAAAVLTGEGHDNAVYELSGDSTWSLAEYAAEVSRQSDRPAVYQQLTADHHHQILLDSGLPKELADALLDAEDLVSRGELARTTGDLSRLIGRPTTPLARTVKDDRAIQLVVAHHDPPVRMRRLARDQGLVSPDADEIDPPAPAGARGSGGRPPTAPQHGLDHPPLGRPPHPRPSFRASP